MSPVYMRFDVSAVGCVLTLSASLIEWCMASDSFKRRSDCDSFNPHPHRPLRRIPIASIRNTFLPLLEILQHAELRPVGVHSLHRTLQRDYPLGLIHVLPAQPEMHEREAIPRGGREALPPLLPPPAGEVLDRPGDILSGLGILHAAVSEVAGGGGAMGGGEEAELGAAGDVEEGKNLVIDLGGD
ncbi:hypothetical protein ACLOJK_007828 [Asimina triloba]